MVILTVVEVDSVITQEHCPHIKKGYGELAQDAKKFKKQFQDPTEGRSLDSILCPNGYNAYC